MPVYLNAAVNSIGEDCVEVSLGDGRTKKLHADSVIMSVGYHPVPIMNEAKNVHLLGDCKKVANVRSAIWGAWDIAMKL